MRGLLLNFNHFNVDFGITPAHAGLTLKRQAEN